MTKPKKHSMEMSIHLKEINVPTGITINEFGNMVSAPNSHTWFGGTFTNNITNQNWTSTQVIGLDFDSTLGYYDMPGFRCGTCYSFPIFDLSNRKTLKLLEFPLIAMECSFFDYANMSYDEAIHYALDLLSKTLFYDGNFVILWHNDKLADENSYYYKLYFELLKANKQLSK
jgi:hypothetical protein